MTATGCATTEIDVQVVTDNLASVVDGLVIVVDACKTVLTAAHIAYATP